MAAKIYVIRTEKVLTTKYLVASSKNMFDANQSSWFLQLAPCAEWLPFSATVKNSICPFETESIKFQPSRWKRLKY